MAEDQAQEQQAAESGRPAEPSKPAAAPPTASAPARSRRLTSAQVRGYAARIVWAVCLIVALFLAAAAFSYALDANASNPLVKLVRHVAEAADLGWFDLDNPIWRATGPNALTKTALANYGAAAVLYLAVGRVLERIIRP